MGGFGGGAGGAPTAILRNGTTSFSISGLGGRSNGTAGPGGPAYSSGDVQHFPSPGIDGYGGGGGGGEAGGGPVNYASAGGGTGGNNGNSGGAGTANTGGGGGAGMRNSSGTIYSGANGGSGYVRLSWWQ
jgi:hypothetical protein